MKPIDEEKAIECLGGEAVFQMAASHFLVEIDQMMQTLSEAVAQGDPQTISEKAHWVKGGLVYLHAGPSAEAAKNLQKAAPLGQTEIEAAYLALQGEVARLKEALKHLSSESATTS